MEKKKKQKETLIPEKLALQLYLYANDELFFKDSPATYRTEAERIKLLGNYYIYFNRRINAQKTRAFYNAYCTCKEDEERQNKYEEYLDMKYACEKEVEENTAEIKKLVEAAEASAAVDEVKTAPTPIEPQTERKRIRNQRCYHRSLSKLKHYPRKK